MPEKVYIKKRYHTDIWNINQNLQTIINPYFEKKNIKINKIEQANGPLSSTANDEDSQDWILDIEELKDLIKWIEKEILKATEFFYKREYKYIYTGRIFMNKMNKNSSAKWHHHTVNGLIGIFYLNAPKNSAKLLTKNEDIIVETGDLIIHKPNLKHAVSEHLIEEPRISLIYEAIFE